MTESPDERMTRYRQRLEQLLRASVWQIDMLLARRSAVALVEGVYILSFPDQPDTVAYVGRTKTKTVRGRIRDHISVNTRSDLRGMVASHPEVHQTPRSYGVRWVEIADPADRAAFELFAIALLGPPFNRP